MARPTTRRAAGGVQSCSAWPLIWAWPLRCSAISVLGPGHMSGIGSPEAVVQVWWLAWYAFAVPHGLNVFQASWLNYPFGQNFGDQGSMLFPRYPFLPITKLFGPVCGLECRGPFGAGRIGDVHVPGAPPMVHVVACGLRRRPTVRVFGLHHLECNGYRLPLSHLRPATADNLPRPSRNSRRDSGGVRSQLESSSRSSARSSSSCPPRSLRARCSWAQSPPS